MDGGITSIKRVLAAYERAAVDGEAGRRVLGRHADGLAVADEVGDEWEAGEAVKKTTDGTAEEGAVLGVGIGGWDGGRDGEGQEGDDGEEGEMHRC